MRSVKACGALAPAIAIALVLVVTPRDAFAQQGGATVHGNAAQPGSARSSSQFTLRRDEAGGPDAQIARSRARAGDCAAALASFDAAINVTVDPTLRRDRGLCHEKLNHPFPAIDDYRAYLTARPEAPDAEQIRQRLAALEEQQGVGGPSSESVKGSDDDKGSGGSASASASMSVGSGGASASASSSSSGKRTKHPWSEGESESGGKSYDYYAAQEKKAEDAETSPLRYGEGVILGAFLHFPRYFVGEGQTSDAGFGAGIALRYAMGGALTLISEIGYAGIGTQGANTSFGGPLLMAGAELKLPLNKYAADQIVLRGGFGYERYTLSGTRSVTNTFLGRFGAGYRHIFGTSLGLEILADGGPAYASPDQGDGRVIGLIAASAAILVAF